MVSSASIGFERRKARLEKGVDLLDPRFHAGKFSCMLRNTLLFSSLLFIFVWRMCNNCGLIVEIFVEIRNSFFYGLYARSRSINLKGTRSMVWKERICSLALFIFTRPVIDCGQRDLYRVP